MTLRRRVGWFAAGLFTASVLAATPVGGTETDTTTTSIEIERVGSTATLLEDGNVLVAGGDTGVGATASAELYDAETETWMPTSDMETARRGHAATRLNDGTVLVAGGDTGDGDTATAERYDPIEGLWSATGSMAIPRSGHTATLLPDGRVLVESGTDDGAPSEVYDPSTGEWSAAEDDTAADPAMSEEDGTVDAPALLAELKASMAGIHGGSFEFQLQNVQDFRTAGQTPEACAALEGFIDRIGWLSGKRITTAQADAALAVTPLIESGIGC